MNLKLLKEKRNDLVDQMKAMQVGAEIERRSLTSTEMELFNYIEKEVRELDNEIQGIRGAFKPVEGEHVTRELRQAEQQLNNELRGLDGTGTATAGVMIPNSISNDIIKDIAEISQIFDDCKCRKGKGKYKQVKRKAKNSVAWTGEFEEVLKSKATYEGIELDQYKISGLDTISLELFLEADFNIANEIKENFAEDLAVKVEHAIFYGDGVKKPTGLLNGVESVETELNADLLIDMITGIKSKYTKTSKFYMNRTMLAKIRKLKDNTGAYIFDSTSNKILGYDYAITENLDNEIVFGSMKHGYMLNINPEFILNILKEKYIDQGAYGIVLHAMLDGKPIDKNAYVINKIAEPVVATTRTRKAA